MRGSWRSRGWERDEGERDGSGREREHVFRMRRLVGIIARSENRRFDNRRNAAPLAPPQSHPRHPRLSIESVVGLISIQLPRIYVVYFRERSISGGNEAVEWNNGVERIDISFLRGQVCPSWEWNDLERIFAFSKRLLLLGYSPSRCSSAKKNNSFFSLSLKLIPLIPLWLLRYRIIFGWKLLSFDRS